MSLTPYWAIRNAIWLCRARPNYTVLSVHMRFVIPREGAEAWATMYKKCVQSVCSHIDTQYISRAARRATKVNERLKQRHDGKAWQMRVRSTSAQSMSFSFCTVVAFGTMHHLAWFNTFHPHCIVAMGKSARQRCVRCWFSLPGTSRTHWKRRLGARRVCSLRQHYNFLRCAELPALLRTRRFRSACLFLGRFTCCLYRFSLPFKRTV